MFLVYGFSMICYLPHDDHDEYAEAAFLSVIFILL